MNNGSHGAHISNPATLVTHPIFSSLNHQPPEHDGFKNKRISCRFLSFFFLLSRVFTALNLSRMHAPCARTHTVFKHPPWVMGTFLNLPIFFLSSEMSFEKKKRARNQTVSPLNDVWIVALTRKGGKMAGILSCNKAVIEPAILRHISRECLVPPENW